MFGPTLADGARYVDRLLGGRVAVRRRLDEIFGDVLPDVTRDEQREAADEPPPAAGDEWLRANRPPHHGG